MCGRVQDLVYKVLLLEPRALYAPSAACLHAKSIGLDGLDMTRVRVTTSSSSWMGSSTNSSPGSWMTSGTTRLCVLLFDRLELGRDHDGEKPSRVAQNHLELGDRRSQLSHLAFRARCGRDGWRRAEGLSRM